MAWNRLTGADGRGLGWFSLFVAITALPIAADALRAADSTWDWWLGLSWAAWAVLWLMFFLLLALHKPIARATAWMAIVQGMGTAWLPEANLLTGALLAPPRGPAECAPPADAAASPSRHVMLHRKNIKFWH